MMLSPPPSLLPPPTPPPLSCLADFERTGRAHFWLAAPQTVDLCTEQNPARRHKGIVRNGRAFNCAHMSRGVSRGMAGMLFCGNMRLVA